MVKQYIHPKFMKSQNTPVIPAVTGEVLVFGSRDIMQTINEMEKMVEDHAMCEALDLRDQRLYIPRFESSVLINGVVNLMGTAIEHGGNMRNMIRNYILTEVLDTEHAILKGVIYDQSQPDVATESIEQLTDACELLLNQILKVYDITHSRDDGRHGYELLKISGSGVLFVCRFSLDY